MLVSESSDALSRPSIKQFKLVQDFSVPTLLQNRYSMEHQQLSNPFAESLNCHGLPFSLHTMRKPYKTEAVESVTSASDPTENEILVGLNPHSDMY